jgi:type VI secretion system secreted protein VgrG
VVVGCFYHEEMPPVFPVPEQQTKQGFRSRSTLKGGTQDYNELSFDDRKGQELVLLHAQKDHKIEVEHDQDATIGNNRTVTTQGNDSLTTVIGDISVKALGGQIDIQAVAGSITIQADSLLGGVTVSAKEQITLTVGGSAITITPENISIVTGELNIAAGAVTIEAGEVTIATPEFIAPPPGL